MIFVERIMVDWRHLIATHRREGERRGDRSRLPCLCLKKISPISGRWQRQTTHPGESISYSKLPLFFRTESNFREKWGVVHLGNHKLAPKHFTITLGSLEIITCRQNVSNTNFHLSKVLKNNTNYTKSGVQVRFIEILCEKKRSLSF